MELLYQSLTDTAEQIRKKTVSPVELVTAVLDHIENLRCKINSFITVLGEQALQQAREMEVELLRGEYRGPLHGIPIGLKDNIATAGIRTTAGSKILAQYVPSDDAHVVTMLKKAGAIIVGKENMTEFALGPTSKNSHYGNVHNPWDLTCIPGGSSGGSAANVASFQTYASLGTDSGGSVRIPASMCGVVGMKGTYGRVSLRGCLPTTTWSTDHVGPLARSPRDAATILQVISGYDDLDPSSTPISTPDFVKELDRDIKGLIMGIPKGGVFDDVDPEIQRDVWQTIAVLQEMGVQTKEVTINGLEHIGIIRMMGVVDALAYHERFMRSQPNDYGRDAFLRLASAQFARGIDYAKAQRARRLLKEELSRVLRDVDFLISPTVPVPAFPIERKTLIINETEIDISSPGAPSALLTRNTGLANLTGLPSISVPCGHTIERSLPVGVQFTGRPFEEGVVLRVANYYQQARQCPIGIIPEDSESISR